MPAMSAIAERTHLGSDDASPISAGDVDALVRQLVHREASEVQVESGLAGGTMPSKVPPRRDFDMATELLDRAGQAFDFLINRCQSLEHDLEELSERTEAHAAEQSATIEQWKQVSAKLKTQLETTEQVLFSLRNRCNKVEERAVKAEEKSKLLETASLQAAEHAALAENLSTKLHDRVVAAFGIGSRAHPVLEAIATREAAE